MKLEIINGNYLYFTYDIDCLGDLDNINEDDVSIFLRNVFLDISEVYKIDLFGYFKVDIFLDEKIGAFVEITKIDDYISYGKKIDTKVNISVSNFYLKTKDLSKIFCYRPIYVLDDYYYISTASVDNISDLLEFCNIEYKDIDLSDFI